MTDFIKTVSHPSKPGRLPVIKMRSGRIWIGWDWLNTLGLTASSLSVKIWKFQIKIPAMYVKKYYKIGKAESIWPNLPICHFSKKNPYNSGNVFLVGSLLWVSAVGPTPGPTLISTILNRPPPNAFYIGIPVFKTYAKDELLFTALWPIGSIIYKWRNVYKDNKILKVIFHKTEMPLRLSTCSFELRMSFCI